VTALYATLFFVGCALCAISVVWAWRTRHARRVWRRARHDTSKVAIVLELEEKVRELDELTSATIDLR
jgi:hypothetical protein